jgi:hypothetical protein
LRSLIFDITIVADLEADFVSGLLFRTVVWAMFCGDCWAAGLLGVNIADVFNIAYTVEGCA